MSSLHPVDLTTMAGCQRVVEFAIREYGRIDVLFNNAALAHFNWIDDITEDEWHLNTRHEVDLVFFLTQAAARVSVGGAASHMRPPGRAASG